jgi:hypothetical protein
MINIATNASLILASVSSDPVHVRAPWARDEPQSAGVALTISTFNSNSCQSLEPHSDYERRAQLYLTIEYTTIHHKQVDGESNDSHIYYGGKTMPFPDSPAQLL